MLRNKTNNGGGWGLIPLLTIAVLLGPIAAGLLGTLLPAFGGMRLTGDSGFSLTPWAMFLNEPGIEMSIWLSVKTGVISTAIALLGCVLLIAGWHGTRVFKALERILSPLLAMPHAAAALGLAFMIAPSGWASRLLSQWATGWTRPPDLLIVQDPQGIALIAGLIAKELPFLLLMSLAALPQIGVRGRMQVAQSLGYGKTRAWLLLVLPSLYRQIRLPVYAVLAYAMSNVDVAMVLGPTTPPTLSIFILQWMTDPDLSLRAPAAAAALTQLGLVAATILIWFSGERAFAWLRNRSVNKGTRAAGTRDSVSRLFGLSLASFAAITIIGGLISQAIWSFAGRWRFPEALPSSFGLRSWSRHGWEALDVTLVTLGLAIAATLIALVLVLGCLEAEVRRGQNLGRGGMIILYLPLILPQIAFLPGLQILLLQFGAAQGFTPVLISHVIFVLPYVFLALAGPFRAWDARIGTIAATMGSSADGVLWRLRLPMLLAPILTAVAIGMAVSIGQFLPTLMTSGGRVATLTTEALALSSGGDRRAIGVWTLVLTANAWWPFAAALIIPRLVFRNRKGLLHG